MIEDRTYMYWCQAFNMQAYMYAIIMEERGRNVSTTLGTSKELPPWYKQENDVNKF